MGAADAVNRGIAPQRQQPSRIGRAASGRPCYRLDLAQPLSQVQGQHGRPDRPGKGWFESSISLRAPKCIFTWSRWGVRWRGVPPCNFGLSNLRLESSCGRNRRVPSPRVLQTCVPSPIYKDIRWPRRESPLGAIHRQCQIGWGKCSQSRRVPTSKCVPAADASPRIDVLLRRQEAYHLSVGTRFSDAPQALGPRRRPAALEKRAQKKTAQAGSAWTVSFLGYLVVFRSALTDQSDFYAMHDFVSTVRPDPKIKVDWISLERR